VSGTAPPTWRAYAAPARADDLAGLPPTYIDVGDLDLFLDEDLVFAQRLAQAGVPIELHVYPGAYHAFESLGAGTPIAAGAVALRIAALRRALGVD
jgi:acetyl esterase/lipase